MAAKWSADYAERYLHRMETLLFPDLGHKPISIDHPAHIRTRDLAVVVRKIRDTKQDGKRQGGPDIAIRMKHAITGVMTYAVQEGLRDDNPARDLDNLIDKPKTKSRPRLPSSRFTELLQRIDSYQGKHLTRLAVQLSLLIFIRSSELRFARWEEIDFDRARWIIPGERSPIDGVKSSYRGAKMKTEHIVPLSRQALAVLRQIHDLTGRFDLIFPGRVQLTNVRNRPVLSPLYLKIMISRL